MPRPYHHPRFGDPNNIWWGLKMIKRLVMKHAVWILKSQTEPITKWPPLCLYNIEHHTRITPPAQLVTLINLYIMLPNIADKQVRKTSASYSGNPRISHFTLLAVSSVLKGKSRNRSINSDTTAYFHFLSNSSSSDHSVHWESRSIITI
jgi:hypothetical protein